VTSSTRLKIVGLPSTAGYDIDISDKKYIYVCNNIQRDTPKLTPTAILASAFCYGTQAVSMNQEHTKHSRIWCHNALCVQNRPRQDD